MKNWGFKVKQKNKNPPRIRTNDMVHGMEHAHFWLILTFFKLIRRLFCISIEYLLYICTYLRILTKKNLMVPIRYLPSSSSLFSHMYFIVVTRLHLVSGEKTKKSLKLMIELKFSKKTTKILKHYTYYLIYLAK